MTILHNPFAKREPSMYPATEKFPPTPRTEPKPRAKPPAADVAGAEKVLAAARKSVEATENELQRTRAELATLKDAATAGKPVDPRALSDAAAALEVVELRLPAVQDELNQASYKHQLALLDQEADRVTEQLPLRVQAIRTALADVTSALDDLRIACQLHDSFVGNLHLAESPRIQRRGSGGWTIDDIVLAPITPKAMSALARDLEPQMRAMKYIRLADVLHEVTTVTPPL
jgi:hypothetical protein